MKSRSLKILLGGLVLGACFPKPSETIVEGPVEQADYSPRKSPETLKATVEDGEDPKTLDVEVTFSKLCDDEHATKQIVTTEHHASLKGTLGNAVLAGVLSAGGAIGVAEACKGDEGCFSTPKAKGTVIGSSLLFTGAAVAVGALIYNVASVPPDRKELREKQAPPHPCGSRPVAEEHVKVTLGDGQILEGDTDTNGIATLRPENVQSSNVATVKVGGHKLTLDLKGTSWFKAPPKALPAGKVARNLECEKECETDQLDCSYKFNRAGYDGRTMCGVDFGTCEEKCKNVAARAEKKKKDGPKGEAGECERLGKMDGATVSAMVMNGQVDHELARALSDLDAKCTRELIDGGGPVYGKPSHDAQVACKAQKVIDYCAKRGNAIASGRNPADIAKDELKFSYQDVVALQKQDAKVTKAAILIGRAAVLRFLKAPSQAQFVDDNVVLYCPDARAVFLTAHKVDAPNSFGAMIRGDVCAAGMIGNGKPQAVIADCGVVQGALFAFQQKDLVSLANTCGLQASAITAGLNRN